MMTSPSNTAPLIAMVGALWLAVALPSSANPDSSPVSATATVPSDSTNPATLYKNALDCLKGTGVPEDPDKAFELMKKAADLGYADAIGGMGYFYSAGVVVERDYKLAIEWFRKGDEKGSAKAKMNLGLLYANGRGVPKDEKEGLRLIDEAAATGQPDALYAQAETYYFGQFGRPEDYKKAFPSFKAAAEAGHLLAQNTLGFMYREGLGTQRDEKAAIEWFTKAAERGLAKAQSNLGHTIGVESGDRERRAQALKWVILAARQQEITAVKTLEEMEPHLPPLDLAAARKAADKFENQKAKEGQ